MTYRKKKGKYVVHKGDGVYFSLTPEQVGELGALLAAIEADDDSYKQEDARR